MEQLVNHPRHYNLDGKKECIEEMQEQFGVIPTIMFAVLNAYKYNYRKGYKDNTDLDVKKSEWYLKFAVKTLMHNSFSRRIIKFLFPNIYDYIKNSL